MEPAARLEKDLEIINDLLRTHGATPHIEPRQLPFPLAPVGVASFPYSFLGKLRRVASYALDPAISKAPPDTEEDGDGKDPQLEKMMTVKCHLIYHSDSEGFYVPVDFEDVLLDERLYGQALGSSVRLMDELLAVAPFLGIPTRNQRFEGNLQDYLKQLDGDDVPYRLEKIAWVALYAATRQSLDHRSLMLFR